MVSKDNQATVTEQITSSTNAVQKETFVQPVDDDTFGNNDELLDGIAAEDEIALEAMQMMDADNRDAGDLSSTTFGFSVESPGGRRTLTGPNINSDVPLRHPGPSGSGRKRYNATGEEVLS